MGRIVKHCACGFLFDGERVLLGKRSAHRKLYPGVWDTIGGHREDGETLAQTLLREFEEEIAVTPTAFDVAAVLDEPDPDRYGARRYHVYVVSGWRGPGPTMLGAEHSELRWLPIDEALGLGLELAHPGYRDILRKL